MAESYEQQRITCKEAQLQMTYMWADDPAISFDERVIFGDHLLSCPKCYEEYQETIRFINLYNWYVREGKQLLRQPKPALLSTKAKEPVKAVESRGRLFWRLGTAAALAASVVIAIVVGWNALFAPNGISETTLITQSPTGLELQGALVELITPSGRETVPLGQTIYAKDQLQKLLLGDMHWFALNQGSSAKITADITTRENQTSKLRYKIELAQGEAYAEVVPGHPFMVRTDNAVHAIIGTKFSVRTEPGQTDLVVVEGTVRLSTPGSDDKWVDVTAGHTSTILGQSTPTAPTPVDALGGTAWAREFLLKDALARIKPEVNDELLLSLGHIWKQPTPPDLESINYEKWVDEQRDWFAREFPWAIKAESALTVRGIETDYVGILMVSGDIWQFHYPRSFNRPIPEFDPAAIEWVAKYYEVDPDWFSDVVGSGVWARQLKSRASGRIDKPGETYRTVLRQWQADIQGYAESGKLFPDDLLLFTLRANVYLAKTWTAAYLWARTYPEEAEKLLSRNEYLLRYLLPISLSGGVENIPSWLGYLDEQILAAQSAGFTAQELLITPQTSGCQSVASTLGRELSGAVDTFARRDEPAVQLKGGVE